MNITIDTDRRCLLVTSIFRRWLLVNVYAPRLLAWSGSQWALHSDGVPAGDVQICNFNSKADAELYARQNNLTVCKGES